MNIYPILWVIAAAASIPAAVFWIRQERSGIMRVGLAVVYTAMGCIGLFIGTELWAKVAGTCWAAAGIGYILYSAARGAEPPKKDR